MKNGTKNKIMYIDMDGVVVDFNFGIDQLTEEDKQKYKGRYVEVSGIFKTMLPIDRVIESVKYLNNHFDIYILASSSWANDTAL